MGIPFTYVPGYPGGAAIFPAVQRGEVDWHTTAIQSYRSIYEAAIIRTGEALAAWYYPFVDSKGALVSIKELADIPSFDKVYEQAHGKPPSGIEWETLKWVHGIGGVITQAALAAPGTPKEAIADLRTGFYAAIKDPEFLAIFEKQFGTAPIFADADEGLAMFESLPKTDAAIVAFLKKYIKAVE